MIKRRAMAGVYEKTGNGSIEEKNDTARMQGDH